MIKLWGQATREEDVEQHRRMKSVVKRMVQEARKRVKEEWTLNITKNFKGNKKNFGRE